MSASAPLLRPPVPGGRSNSGTKAPKLGLAIPPSANVKPVGSNSTPSLSIQTAQSANARAPPPQLRLATPMGTSATPQEGQIQSGRPPLQIGIPRQNGINGDSSRMGSFSALDGRSSGETSAHSQLNDLSFAIDPRNPRAAGPSSANPSLGSEGGVGMERENSINGLPDFSKLSLEKGRALDVEDLDTDGWRAASEQGQIVELGSLGEGAGGAVTRCKLKEGKTVFALKVCVIRRISEPSSC